MKSPPQAAPFWHRSLAAPAAEATPNPYGFFDSGSHVVVVPDAAVPPEVPVDHEIVHANLIRHSTMGLLDQVISFAWHHAWQDGKAQETLIGMLNALRQAEEAVHEAVAWYSTELYTAGHENLRAPPPYAMGVRQLHKLMQQIPGRSDKQSGPAPVEIAESIAIIALNLPDVLELWNEPGAARIGKFFASLGQREADKRFAAICTRVKGVPYDTLYAWAKLVTEPGEASIKEPPHVSRGGLLDRIGASAKARLSIVTRANFTTDRTYEVIKALVRHTVSDRSAPFISDDMVSAEWDLYSALQFSPFIDKYAQVCIVPRAARTDLRVPVVGAGDLKLLMQAPCITVGVGDAPAFQHAQPVRNPNHVTVSAPYVRSWSAMPMRGEQDWVATIQDARPVLQVLSARRPIVVSSPNYQYATADFRDVELMRDIPHLVMCVTDVNTLWLRLCLLEGSLGGFTDLEYQTIPSATLGPRYGFLVVKPVAKAFPVLVVPIILSQQNRALSVFNSPPEGAKVTIRRSTAPSAAACLGEPMCRAIAAAVEIFEDYDLTPPRGS